MIQQLSRFKTLQIICVMVAICILAGCGFIVFAAEDKTQQTDQTPVTLTALPSPEVYPSDVQVITDGKGQQLLKTYILVAGERPADIPRDDVIRDGWRYTLTDIVQNEAISADTRAHTEQAKISTKTSDISGILTSLSETLEYESEDGYAGLLTLDLSSVKCEAADHKRSSKAISATREYPHLSTNDLSLIPKTITEKGKTLELESVAWEGQQYTNVDYENIPESYKAIATYTGTESISVTTGYITTANYTGEITKTLKGEMIYTAYFTGSEMNPGLKPIAPLSASGMLFLIGIVVIATLFGGFGVYFALHHNTRVYCIKEDGSRALVAKVRLSAKRNVIDLTPLVAHVNDICFIIEIDKFSAKNLNGKVVAVLFGAAKMEHTIAYEGGSYKIEADFQTGAIKALH